MVNSETDYTKFYQLLKKVHEGYQRGLSEAINQTHSYRQEVEELRRELVLSKQINHYLQDKISTRSKVNKEEMRHDISQLLGMDAPEKSEEKPQRKKISPQLSTHNTNRGRH